MKVRVGQYEDETSALCQWHIPETHYLESWGDIRSDNGTTTIMQPLINPLYEGKSAYEVLSAVLGQPTRTSYEIVREAWGTDEKAWRRAVHDGVVAEGNSGDRHRILSFKNSVSVPGIPSTSGGIEVVFRPDPTIYDGRFANNAWLQELPKPLTK